MGAEEGVFVQAYSRLLSYNSESNPTANSNKNVPGYIPMLKVVMSNQTEELDGWVRFCVASLDKKRPQR